MSEERLWTVAEVAQRIGASEQTVRRWVGTRRIPYIKNGRLVRFSPRAIDRWLQKNTREEIDDSQP